MSPAKVRGGAGPPSLLLPWAARASGLVGQGLPVWPSREGGRYQLVSWGGAGPHCCLARVTDITLGRVHAWAARRARIQSAAPPGQAHENGTPVVKPPGRTSRPPPALSPRRPACAWRQPRLPRERARGWRRRAAHSPSGVEHRHASVEVLSQKNRDRPCARAGLASPFDHNGSVFRWVPPRAASQPGGGPALIGAAGARVSCLSSPRARPHRRCVLRAVAGPPSARRG